MTVTASPDEIPYFESSDYEDTTFEEFERLFDCASAGQIIGIKRPSYLTKPECAERIQKHLPDARIIAVLRNL